MAIYWLTWYWSLELAVIVHGKGRPWSTPRMYEAMNGSSASDGETGGHCGLTNRYLISHYTMAAGIGKKGL